ncbi:hypothetical protein ON010_g18204 [Phytophthora cinnamomi]|nr:hypothetical protein ON010_g18204 [Phytophthora cinnamomi]
MQQRRQKASQAVAQRKQQAAAAMQHRKELAAQRKEEAQSMQTNANTVTKAKKWVTLARKKKAEPATTPIEPIE